MRTHVYHITYAPEAGIVHLYFLGCNMKCRGCIRLLNPWDSHLPKKEQVRPLGTLHTLTVEEVLAILAPHPVHKVFFLGDDASIDPALEILGQRLKEHFAARHVLLTSGLLMPSYHLFDDIQVSIKAVTPALHRDFTGTDVGPVLENFCRLYNAGVALRSESILIPGYIDVDEIERIARFIASVDSEIPYRIDAYIPVPGTPWPRPTLEDVERAAQKARRHLHHVSVLHRGKGQVYRVIRLV